MTVLNPPGWEQNAGATHTAAQMRSYIGGLMGPISVGQPLVPAGGVNLHLGNKLQVTQSGSPAMSVVVKSGIAFIPGTENGNQGAYGVMNDADLTLTVTANGSGLARIDSVFFKVEDSQYSGGANQASLVVVAGTPSGSPVAPAAPNNALRLANIAVANGAVSITNANITDVRTYLAGAGSAKAPDVQLFTSSGTWTRPDGARTCYIRAVGGGGAGGGASATAANQHSNGGGGGAGGYAEHYVDAQTLAATVTITVGTGGAGVSAAAGGNGTASSFGSIVVVGGGTGASLNTVTGGVLGIDGGAGGTATAGTIRYAGSAGGASWGSASVGSSGSGASTPLGGGGAARGVNANGQSFQGGDATGYGAGGGGAMTCASASANRGGNGAPGAVIVVSWF
jgi:hypothetical protein